MSKNRNKNKNRNAGRTETEIKSGRKNVQNNKKAVVTSGGRKKSGRELRREAERGKTTSASKKAELDRRYKEKTRLLIGLSIMFVGAVFLMIAAFLRKNTPGVKDGFATSKGSVTNGRESYITYDFAMGTSISVSVYGNMNSKTIITAAEELAERVSGNVKNTDSIISWRNSGSALGVMNAEGGMKLNETDTADGASESESIMSDMIRYSLMICRDSGGALDITIRPLADAWGIENYDQKWEDYTPPDEKTLLEAKEQTGYQKIVLSDNEIDLGKTTVDFGSVGKGYALDRVAEQLRAESDSSDGIKDKSVVLTVGGSILVYGTGNISRSFKIGVRDPEGTISDTVGYIEFKSNCGKVCISTSGSYEKYIEKDGVRYHHIIDPETMKPAESGLSSVTVVCDENSLYPEYSGLISDGLSTACFVLGKDEALKLLEKYKAEAVFIDTEGNISCTDGLRNIFKKNK